MDDPAAVIEQTLRAVDVPFVRAGEKTWAAQLSGTNKLTIPVVLMLRDRALVLESFFMRRPAENADAVYRMLLQRNMRMPGVWFAVDDVGDVHLVGQLPLEAITPDALDRLLGALLQVADETFNAAVQTGFATYLARDMAWRAKQSGA